MDTHGRSGGEVGPEFVDLIAYLRLHHPEIEQRERDGMGDRGPTAITREVGALYEKLRFAIDNKEEHFFRRHAIRRILRRISLFSSSAERMLDILLSDLERAGYLREENISDERRSRALRSLSAFISFQGALRDTYDSTTYHVYRKYLLDIISGAVEDDLCDTSIEEGTVVLMARMADKVLRGEQLLALDHDKRRTLVYIASWRSLFSGDSSLLRYKLWLFEHADWDGVPPESLEAMARSFPRDISRINKLIDSPLGRQLVFKLHDLTIAFSLIYDAMLEYGTGIESVLADRPLFESRIRDFIEVRYRRDITRASRRSLRVIFYILATKSVLAVFVESAYVLLFHHALNYVALVINLVAHPALLFAVTSGLRKPGARNTERALALVGALVYRGHVDTIIVPPSKQGILTDLALGLYVGVLTASCWGIISGLRTAGFHAVDIIFFLFFLVLVLYFGFRIRHGAYRMRFSGAKEGILHSTAELLLLPLVSLGRYMSIKFENINIAVLFLDFFIEAPLRMTLRFVDSFSSLVERKREEIYTP